MRFDKSQAVFFLSIASMASAGATTVCGAISSDTTWTKAASPYQITCNSVLATAKTLSIQPGVSVVVDPGVGLTVRGKILSKGTKTAPISWTVNGAPTDRWRGIALATNLGASGEFDYTQISRANAAISVECCYGSPSPAMVTNSSFIYNDTALSGYAGNPLIVKNTKFISNLVGADSADKIIYDSLFLKNEFGLQRTERVSVYRSEFSRNGTAANGGRGTIQGSLFHDNSVAVSAFFEGFQLSGNSFYRNNTGVVLGSYDNQTVPVNQNNFFENSGYAAINSVAYDQNLATNWWGTTDPNAVAAAVYDFNDDINLGAILFDPLATSKFVPQVGISVSKAKLIEGGRVLVTVALSALSVDPVSVSLAAGGNAVPGVDFEPSSIPATLQFDAGTSTASFTVQTIDNATVQKSRVLSFTLTGPINAKLSESSSVEVKILDND